MKSNQKHSHYTVESFQLTVALLGRFLPRLGPFRKSNGLFFFRKPHLMFVVAVPLQVGARKAYSPYSAET